MSDLFPHCCARCHADQIRAESLPWWHAHSVMYVCHDCGNKRCPKATFHGNDCTGSNDPGQSGSMYGGRP